MSTVSPLAVTWADENQRALVAALHRVQGYLDGHGDGSAAAAPHPEPATLARLAAAFGLSRFERDVILLCAGPDLDGGFDAALRNSGRSAPNFALALAVLPEAHWTALTPASPLRYWGLVELTGGSSPVTAQLRLDEHILHFLAGAGYADERLDGVVRAVELNRSLPPSHAEVAGRIAEVCRCRPAPLVGLWGADASGKRGVAAGAAGELGLNLRAVRAADIPAGAAERAAFARLWERAAALGGCALLIDLHEDDGAPDTVRAVVAFAETVCAPTLIAAREPLRELWRPVLAFDVPRPGTRERLSLWRDVAGAGGAELDSTLEALATHFELGSREIANTVDRARMECSPAPLSTAALWSACRREARPRLEDLARRIEARVGWGDLVLPAADKEALREITAQVRQRARVYDAWGFGERTARGLGVTALFSGPSGTGKTMAAEVLATELSLDLYQIDLSQVVSKYIGETEKNLRRVFDAAEQGGAILLFDEADALFGRRSEVKDSHDRYANVEVSYLLQRMEEYRGLAILTTNRREALDRAFLRRLRFAIDFPFPGYRERLEIWKRAFPTATPSRGLKPEKLAQLNVAGGNIQSIALHASFLAADEGDAVGMGHLLRAARRECAKLERPLSATEIAGWT